MGKTQNNCISVIMPYKTAVMYTFGYWYIPVWTVKSLFMVCISPCAVRLWTQLLGNHWTDFAEIFYDFAPPYVVDYIVLPLWVNNFLQELWDFINLMHYNIRTLCGCNSSDTTEPILLKFCRIVSHHI